MKQITVDGYEKLKEEMAKIKKIYVPHHRAKFFIYFTGSKLPETGQSWCPDCVNAEPIVQQALQRAFMIDGAVIICNVGYRDEWKDPANPMKANPNLGVKCIPTLIEFSPEHLRAFDGRKLEKDEDFADSDRIWAFLKNEQ